MIRWIVQIWIGFLLCGVLNFEAFAQSNDSLRILQQVEVTARRNTKLKVLQSQSIDSLTLKQTENLNLSDLLSEHTHVFVKNEGRGALSTVSLRGTSSSHTDVKWNGISLKSPMFGEVDFSLVPVFLVDEMNVFQGGSSISQGVGGIGGTISLNNKADWQNRFNLLWRQDYGSFRSMNQYLKLSFGNSKIQSKTRIFYNYSENNFPFINKNIAQLDQNGQLVYPKQKNTFADYRLMGLLQELYFRIGPKGNLSLRYWGQTNNRGLPRLNTYEGDDFSNISRTEGTNHRMVAQYEHIGSWQRIEIQTALSSEHLTYYMKNFVGGNGYQVALYTDGQALSNLNQARYEFNFLSTTKLSATLDYQYSQAQSNDTIHHQSYDAIRHETVLGFQWQQSYYKSLKSILIFKQQIIDKHLVPSVYMAGIEYALDSASKHLIKISLAKNIKNPSLNDLYWMPGGNPLLKPEQAIIADLQMSNALVWLNRQVDLQTGVYYSQITDWILWLPNPMGYWSPENVQKVQSSGLYSSIKWQGKLGHFFKYTHKFNYALTSSINQTENSILGTQSYGKQLPYIPKHTFNYNLRLDFKGYFFNYQHVSYSERFTSSSNDAARRDWLYPYFMNGLSLGKSLAWHSLYGEIQFKIENLFDETYRSVLGRAMPGRNYWITLIFKIEKKHLEHI